MTCWPGVSSASAPSITKPLPLLMRTPPLRLETVAASAAVWPRRNAQSAAAAVLPIGDIEGGSTYRRAHNTRLSILLGTRCQLLASKDQLGNGEKRVEVARLQLCAIRYPTTKS